MTPPHERLYVCVDEGLKPGARLAQCAHAVAEVHAAAADVCRAWRSSSNVVVVLAVPVDRLARLAATPGAAAFREPDLGNELTAVALFPRDPEALRIVRRARLAC